MTTTLPVTLEQPTRARLVAAGNTAPERGLTVALRYASADPLAISLVFPAEVTLTGTEVTWAFARSLLDEGLRAPSGAGDVHVWPSGRTRTAVELHAPRGLAVVEFGSSALRRFLRRTYALVAAGDEDLTDQVHRALKAFFGPDGGGAAG
ncbi:MULTISPECIES: SsgA family sporulation/cell division regulator [unclassified Streptomyces]|uniref:SsgA family sporulation/cell division regulator n=1 Tax=unclassified Streptomyces TaxID=2593676 RepID=UPI000DB9042D|nr:MULTISPECIES: SsgA family sporulation/cell division regulator [unclassified Streptomyces]MYT73740.1 SsgA family sporulation/cell division regulator [Streptomyces sp. SID8367]RAJ85281.1 sporulation and cell division protein SsgA [Streptomyces sp. PsTaAH-137]